MKQIISDVADQFYEQIIENKYFADFFKKKDFECIKDRLKDYVTDQINCHNEELNFDKSYQLGKMHAANNIPLNNVLNFMDYIQRNLMEMCAVRPELTQEMNPENIETMKNLFAKGYLHESIHNADMMTIPLYSILSTTKIATSVTAWIIDIHETVLNETGTSSIISTSSSCSLIPFLNKPFFNMVFDNESNYREFNKMHTEMHNTANSLMYFIDIKQYTQAYFIYSDLVDQCKSFMNYYLERIVLFEQNKEHYFYKYAADNISNGKEIAIFTFNLRNMQVINRVWGYDYGDFLVTEAERVIDRHHGMDSRGSVFIKTKNAEFLVMIIAPDKSEILSEFDDLLLELSNSLRVRGDFNTEMKISSSFIQLGSDAAKYMRNLKEIVRQAIASSKDKENKPLICSTAILERLNENVVAEKRIRYFIRQSFNKDNFKPYYHCIVDSSTMETAHYEVLARVCDTESCVSAGEFIDYMVKTGRIVDLDKVMLEKVEQDLPLLKKHTERLFINISPKSLRSHSYVNKLSDFIKAVDKAGMNTVFEITEQSLFNNIETVKELHRKYGSVFAIDDFGSGYSNFSIVAELAEEGLVKYLKIDGTLIKDINENIYKEHVVMGIVRIADSLNLKTVAEFVSSESIVEKVKSIGVSHMQGFYFSPPKPLEDFQT